MARDAEALHVGGRDDVRVARLVQHQGHLAEVVAALERQQVLLAAARLGVRALDLAALDDEEVVALLALGDDARARGEGDLLQRVADLLEGGGI